MKILTELSYSWTGKESPARRLSEVCRIISATNLAEGDTQSVPDIAEGFENPLLEDESPGGGRGNQAERHLDTKHLGKRGTIIVEFYSTEEKQVPRRNGGSVHTKEYRP